jgi:hypothetical protein
LCSTIVCLFDEDLLSGFQLGRQPFGDQDTGIWKGAVQQQTQQETDVQFTGSILDFSLDSRELGAHKFGHQTSLLTVHDASMCCLTLSTQQPPSVQLSKGSATYGHDQLAKFRDSCQQYSVTFKPGFWDGLEGWATQGKEAPPCLAFLQHTFPRQFEKMVEEVVPLREEALTCKLEHDKARSKLEQEDGQRVAELGQAMRERLIHWFPVLGGAVADPSASALEASPPGTSEGTAAEADSDSWCEVDDRYGLADHGFTREAIEKLSANLRTFSAVAQVFSTRYRKTCRSTYQEIYHRLANRETTVQCFIAGNTKRSPAGKSKTIKKALQSAPGALLSRLKKTDERPSTFEAEEAVKLEVQLTMEAVEAQQLKEAADDITKKICITVKLKLASSRSERVAAPVAAALNRATQLEEVCSKKVQAILSDLEHELSDPTRLELTLEACKHVAAAFRYQFPWKWSAPQLALTWTAQEEIPGSFLTL